jgi:hypothetical protein
MVMGKRARKDKSEENEFEQEITDIEDLPENVLEILALIGTAASIMLKETNIGAFSGRHDEFIFTLVYDPSGKIDEDNYKSAIVDVIKKVDPAAISINIPSPFEEDNEEEDNY